MNWILIFCVTWGFAHGTGKFPDPEIITNMSMTGSRFPNVSDNPIQPFGKGPVTAVVELLVVMDKDLGDRFGQDKEAILNYLNIYFWDVSVRFKTLRSVKISFRITGVKVFSDWREQMFLEEIVGQDHEGKINVDYAWLLERFNTWIRERLDLFPKFDVAMLMTAVQGSGQILGYAPFKACDPRVSTMIVHDLGTWELPATTAHEFGHALGALHDNDYAECDGIHDKIMNRSGAFVHKWYFSKCSDRSIFEFLASPSASCLRTLDQDGQLPISPDFSTVKAPDMTEQCKMLLNNPNAFVRETDTRDCGALNCVLYGENWPWQTWRPLDLDNTPCLGGGRCFRGRCRKSGSLIQNVRSGKCLVGEDNTVQMSKCVSPSSGTPLERFLVMEGDHGKILSTPYAYDSYDVCIFINNHVKSNGLFLSRCDTKDIWQGWDFVDIGNDEFLLRHRKTGKCVTQAGNNVKMSETCQKKDLRMRWILM